MKKNLIALVALLLLVALAAQFTRHGGKNAEWVALENDMLASLEALWEQPGQKVELVESEGGVRVLATVAMPPEGDLTWNEPFLRFVATRHPAVSLQAIEVRGPTSECAASNKTGWTVCSDPAKDECSSNFGKSGRNGERPQPLNCSLVWCSSPSPPAGS